MANNFYMQNRHKLLLMAEELHKMGYGLLRVVPSLSPSGMYWRCSFVDRGTKTEVIASSWIYTQEESGRSGEIIVSAKELAAIFVRDNGEFIARCVGDDETYTTWYRGMLAQLEADELPYAFAEYFSPGEFWKTSGGKEIKTLPGDIKYYFNY